MPECSTELDVQEQIWNTGNSSMQVTACSGMLLERTAIADMRLRPVLVRYYSIFNYSTLRALMRGVNNFY